MQDDIGLLLRTNFFFTNILSAQDLVLTASGDGTAHIWKATAAPDALSSIHGSGLGFSSAEESAESSEDDNGLGGSAEKSTTGHRHNTTLKSPMCVLEGHQVFTIFARSS